MTNRAAKNGVPRGNARITASGWARKRDGTVVVIPPHDLSAGSKKKPKQKNGIRVTASGWGTGKDGTIAYVPPHDSTRSIPYRRRKAG